MRIEYLIPLVSYLLGSIPFGYLLVKSTEGKDIRAFGSGNIGATNVFRKSRLAGILTLVLDAGKGYLAVLLAGWLGGGIEWQAAAAVFAIIGHIFTIWLRFKGGKGVATAAGMFLSITPLAFVFSLAAWLVMVALWRYISVGSIVGAIVLPVAVYFTNVGRVKGWESMFVVSLAVTVLVLAAHRNNIRRILNGTERKFSIRGG